MAGIDEVLERLVTDQRFRSALAQDPEATLAGYELSDHDHRLLAAQLTSNVGGSGHVERRTSKSALGALGSALAEGLGAAPDAVGGSYAAPEQDPEEIHLLIPAVQAAREVGGPGPEAPDDLVAPGEEPEELLLPAVQTIREPGPGESTGRELDQDTDKAPAYGEWKYVPVRPFDQPSDSDQTLASPSAVDASGLDVGLESELQAAHIDDEALPAAGAVLAADPGVDDPAGAPENVSLNFEKVVWNQDPSNSDGVAMEDQLHVEGSHDAAGAAAGDPDRPVIGGAVPNADEPGPQPTDESDDEARP